MKKSKVNIPFDYITVKTTKSRIDYGFLTIPISLMDSFPKKSTEIFLINETGKEEVKTFVPYSTKNRESRIYGLSNFFKKYKIQDGDEIVIQIIDENKYKLIPEKNFKNNIVEAERKIEHANTDEEVEKYIELLSAEVKKTKEEVVKSEFLRLSQQKFSQRNIRSVSTKAKESVPPLIRKILLEVYKGRCQLTNFTFITKSGLPYFEIHHIRPNLGHHPKNLLVVCPNVHRQFDKANVEEYFDSDGWLRKVKFNDDEFFVRQAIDFVTKEYFKEVHYP